MFSIAAQMLDKLETSCDLPIAQVPVLRRIAKDRAAVIQELGMSKEEGKELLNAVINGQGLDDEAPEHDVINALQKEGRFLRWVAVSSLTPLFRRLCVEPDRKWPEATCLHYWWTPVEDYSTAMGRSCSAHDSIASFAAL